MRANLNSTGSLLKSLVKLAGLRVKLVNLIADITCGLVAAVAYPTR